MLDYFGAQGQTIGTWWDYIVNKLELSLAHEKINEVYFPHLSNCSPGVKLENKLHITLVILDKKKKPVLRLHFTEILD